MTSAAGTSANKPPFMAFATDDADAEMLKNFASAHQWAQADIHKGDIRTATDFLKNHASPSLLLVEIPSAAEAAGLLDALADVCEPGTRVVAIGDINEYSFFCWLTDIGIVGYLLKPLKQPGLELLYQKTIVPHHEQAAPGKPPANVIAVIGARGGVGASVLSLNLAGIIAEVSKKQVALVDVDPQSGSIALSLDIEPSRGLRDVLEKPDRIDSLFIERVMSKPLDNLSVLSAEEALHDRVAIHETAAPMLLKELREQYEVIILDIPRHLNAYSRQCLKLADQVVMVSELSLLSLRDALRIGDMMRETLKMNPPIYVVNRAGAVPKHEIQLADFEKGITGKVTARIPFAPEVFMQISTEIPALKMKSHAAIKPLRALAEHLLPELKDKAAVAAPVKKPGFFAKKKPKEA